ncbi:MAG TPA: hypothetical protein VHT26_07625 [Trebonia sp.]|nr:hypothetical protein [Trebonia sp.]
MKIPTKAETNGRTLYTVLATDPKDEALFTCYVGYDQDKAIEYARGYNKGVVLACTIAYDAREMGQE